MQDRNKVARVGASNRISALCLGNRQGDLESWFNL